MNASGSGSQQPPPPPPGIAEVLAAQTELLRQLVQGQQRCGHHAHQPQAASLKVIGCSSLRGGGGELGTNKNLDLWLQLVCTKLKLKHAI